MVDELSPEYLKSVLIDHIKHMADCMAIRFLCPIYLVGSFVEGKEEDCGDVDIVMVASDDRIARLLGGAKWSDKWFRFYKKQKLFLEKHIHGVDIDFKVQSYEKFKRYHGPRILLTSEKYHEIQIDSEMEVNNMSLAKAWKDGEELYGTQKTWELAIDGLDEKTKNCTQPVENCGVCAVIHGCSRYKKVGKEITE